MWASPEAENGHKWLKGRRRVKETKRWLPHAGHRRHTLVYLEELLAPPSGPLLTGDRAHDRKDAGWLLRSASESCLLSQTRSACAPVGQPEPAPGLRAPQQLIRLQVLHPDVTGGLRISSLVSGKRLTAHTATAGTCSECLSCRWSVRCWPPAAREVKQALGQEAWAAPCSVAIPPEASQDRAPQPGASCGLPVFALRQHLPFLQRPLLGHALSHMVARLLGSWEPTLLV